MTAIRDEIGPRLRRLREEAGIAPEQLDERLILGPGWVARFEAGATLPSIDTLLVLLQELGRTPSDLFDGIGAGTSPVEVERLLRATQTGPDLLLRFPYGAHDAEYTLRRARIEDFEAVVKVLRDGLAREVIAINPQAVKTAAVATCFLEAVRRWPHANPSDLWYFLVLRAYLDPFNHPAQFARLDFSQSWKRTGGWSLESVLVRHYSGHLSTRGIRLYDGGPAKGRLAAMFTVADRLELDKIDVLLAATHRGLEIPFGVVHVKASFAERRTDDVPMSRALIAAGYCSPLWTMDCKASPSTHPVNRGELGPTGPLGGGLDRRSAKRRDIEDDGYFSACFAYNHATMPTPPGQAVRSAIIGCDFRNPDDAFAGFIVDAWRSFSAGL